MSLGAVACGHPATAAAAEEILREGGNAFDAALAAYCMASVAEPVLCSLGGGGFLLACSEDRRPELFDFFVSTPRQPRPAEELSFYPVLADFGTDTQEFHIGLGSATAPTGILGLVECHEALASLPLARIVEPAARAARAGLPITAMQARIFQVVSPILTDHAEGRSLFCKQDGSLVGEGDTLRFPELAESLERIAAEGARPLLEGDWGASLLRFSDEEGGQLCPADISALEVRRRAPLHLSYRGVEIDSNPGPSAGGVLILFALALLQGQAPSCFGTGEELVRICRAMDLANRARRESGLGMAEGEEELLTACARLASPDFMASFRQAMESAQVTRGTTHISVTDSAGNIAALSLSNGEGCGRYLPGTGIQLNNMLGEEDLSPRGFHRWPRGTRLGSMMAPSLAFFPDGRRVALGSGGSNRIRSAILQVLINLIDHGVELEEAILAPRLHIEGDVGHAEEGLPLETLAGEIGQRKPWPKGNIFFGGVHGVSLDADGGLLAAGDNRRGGVGVVI